MIYNFLFSSEPRDTKNSVLLLIARIIFGSLLLYHGIQKLGSFSELSSSFPDPLGIGNQLSLSLVIFGELVCSLGFIFGLLYRLTMIPMIFTMGIAFFVFHRQDPFVIKELSFNYLVVYLIMYITGPGKYTIDRFLFLKKKSK